MDNLFTVKNREGKALYCDLTRDEMYRLRGLERNQATQDLHPVRESLVEKTKRPYVWVTLVHESLLKAAVEAMRKKPSFGSTSTGYWETFRTSKGRSQVFALNLPVSFSYPTTALCASEHAARQ